MAQNTPLGVRQVARSAVPFLVSTVLWSVVMLVLYGAFLVTKPDASYPAWAHASVFVPPMVGFAGHVLRLALDGHRA